MSLSSDVELLETLGEGNFGVVYVARVREGALARTVVLKVLKRQYAENDQAIVRARDEAALLARLNHDHIVKVEQLTTLEGMPTVVMEHVLGLTLDRLVQAKGPLPVGVVLDIAVRVASALDAAYSRVPPGEREPLRVVHRDIKPSNVIISVNGSVKVLDFGAARGDFEDRLAITEAMAFGTPLYMSPEIFEGAAPLPSVDIYALGATMFELLTGEPLGTLSFKPNAHARKLGERLDKLRPRDLTENAAGPLRALLAATLAYDPEERPTAREFQARCRAYKARLGRTTPLDLWAEQVVEPLYAGRVQRPPASPGSLLVPPAPPRSGVLNAQSTDWTHLVTLVPPTPVPAFIPTAMLEELDLDPLETGETVDPPEAWDDPSAARRDAPRTSTPKPLVLSPTPPSTPVPPPPKPPLPARARPYRPLILLALLGLLLGLGVVLLAAALLRLPGPPAQAGPIQATEGPGAPEETREPAAVAEPTPIETTPPRPVEVAPAVVPPAAPPPKSAQPPKATPTPKETRTPKASPQPAGTPAASDTRQTELKRPPAPVEPAQKVQRIAFRSLPASADLLLAGKHHRMPYTADELSMGPLTATVTFTDGALSVSDTCEVRIAKEGQVLIFKLVEGRVHCP